MEEVEF
jgi:hypothetical protein